MADHNYDYWRAAVAGKKPKMFVDEPMLGFYRKSINERNEKGNSRRVGWTPVAIFLHDGALAAAIGDRAVETDRDKLNELWTWIAGNAISEEWFRAVERGEPWPDAHDAAKNKASPVADAIAALQDAGVPNDKIAAALDGESPEQKLAREISELSKGVSQYGVIDSDTMAGQVLSLKNELTTEAGRLDKMREALVRPHIEAQRSINDQWNPVIKEAKALCATLLRKIGVWEDTKREAANRARALADAKALEHEEAVRAAEAANAPPPPPPVAPVASNAPPPSTQVAAAVGRKASVKIAKFVTSIDLDKAFAMFRTDPAVNACLIALAQRAVDAGLAVDGAVIDERSVVR